MKRLICFLILAFCVFGIYEWSSDLLDEFYIRTLQKSWKNPSVFTNNEVIQSQQIYQGKTVRVLYNYKPLLHGHVLIIPIREVVRFEDLTDEELIEMKAAIAMMHKAYISAYHAPDYLLVLQNGLFAGQTVPQVHFHMLPRGEESIVITKFKLWQQFITEAIGLRKTLSKEEQQKEIQLLQHNL